MKQYPKYIVKFLKIMVQINLHSASVLCKIYTQYLFLDGNIRTDNSVCQTVSWKSEREENLLFIVYSFSPFEFFLLSNSKIGKYNL